MQRIDGKHLKHNCMQHGCLPKNWDREKLRERFFALTSDFSIKEMENPITKQSIELAISNVYKELKNVARK